MGQYNFGTGNLYGTPVGGGAPVKFGALQDVSIDISFDLKMLYGSNSFPLSVARGKAKIEGKCSDGAVNPTLWNNLFFAQTLTSGYQGPVFAEAHVIPAVSTYTVTVTNAASFVMDLGVHYAASGVALTQVSSGPTVGQYSVSAGGVYTFAAADEGLAVTIDYICSFTGGTGNSIAINNQLMGAAPNWQMVLAEQYNGKTLLMTLYCCTSSKMSMPFKQDDFQLTEMDFGAFANSAGNVGFISVSG